MIPQRIELTEEEEAILDQIWNDMADEDESESQSMSTPTGGTPPPQSGVRTVHTPRAIGAIPAKPTAKRPPQQRPTPSAKPKPSAPKPSAPKRKK